MGPASARSHRRHSSLSNVTNFDSIGRISTDDIEEEQDEDGDDSRLKRPDAPDADDERDQEEDDEDSELPEPLEEEVEQAASLRERRISSASVGSPGSRGFMQSDLSSSAGSGGSIIHRPSTSRSPPMYTLPGYVVSTGPTSPSLIRQRTTSDLSKSSISVQSALSTSRSPPGVTLGLFRGMGSNAGGSAPTVLTTASSSTNVAESSLLSRRFGGHNATGSLPAGQAPEQAQPAQASAGASASVAPSQQAGLTANLTTPQVPLPGVASSPSGSAQSLSPQATIVSPPLPLPLSGHSAQRLSSTPFLSSPLAQASMAPDEEDTDTLENFGLERVPSRDNDETAAAAAKRIRSTGEDMIP